MIIENKEILILSAEPKERLDKNSGIKIPYMSIGIAAIEDGSPFTINSTNMELSKLKPFSKYIADLVLTNSKYGLKLEITKINSN